MKWANEQGSGIRGGRFLLDVFLVLAVLLTGLAWWQDPFELRWGPVHLTVSKGLKPGLITLLLAGLRGLVAWRGVRIRDDVQRVFHSPWFLRPALALGSVVAFFAVFELVLIAVGFEADVPPIVIRGDPRNDEPRRHFMRPDPELRWSLNPGAEFNGRFVNRMGFFDRQVEPAKSPGTQRVICLGDSCTAQGIPPYSGFLHQRLQETPPTDEPWEAFNMAVHGYSSTQGLRLFQTRTRRLQPDVVTLYFGWNDHWLSRAPDRELMGIRVRSGTAYIFDKLKDRRFFQFMLHTLRPDPEVARIDDEFVLRVSPSEYEQNLREFVREIRGLDALPILITAPRDRELTPLLIKNNQAKDLDDVIRLHDQYNDIVRRIGRETGVDVLDAAAAFVDLPAEEYFSQDGIHLTRRGRIWLADRLHALLAEAAAEGRI